MLITDPCNNVLSSTFIYCKPIFIYSWQIVTITVRVFFSVSFKINLKNCSATD